MTNFLVTGAAGFIGANFVQYMREKRPDDRIIVLDILTYAGNINSLSSVRGDDGFSFIKGDKNCADNLPYIFSLRFLSA